LQALAWPAPRGRGGRPRRRSASRSSWSFGWWVSARRFSCPGSGS